VRQVLIVAIDGRPIVSAAQLHARVGLVPVGETIQLAVLRNGNRLELNAGVAVAVP
jgi:S1-C subfamily serine protease